MGFRGGFSQAVEDWLLAVGCWLLRVAGCVRTCFVREMQDVTGTGWHWLDSWTRYSPEQFSSFSRGGRVGGASHWLRWAAAGCTNSTWVPTAAALGHRPGSEIATNRAASEMTSTFRHETGSSASCRAQPLSCGERERSGVCCSRLNCVCQ